MFLYFSFPRYLSGLRWCPLYYKGFTPQFESQFRYKTLDYINEFTDEEGIHHSLSENLIVSYSKKRARKDQKDRERLVEKANKLLENPEKINASQKRGGRKYIDRIDPGKAETWKLALDKIERDAKFDGYYGIQTSEKNMSATDVMDAYHTLWKLHEAGRDNVGVEAAHRTELVGETTIRASTRYIKRRIRTRPARQAAKWERRNIKAGADHRFRQLTHEHPEIKRNALSRYLYKKQIQRKYRKKAYQEAQRAAKSAKKTAVTTEKIAAGVFRFVRRHPVGIVIALLCFLLIVLLQSCIGGALSIGSGLGGGIIASTSYLAGDADIDEAELQYTHIRQFEKICTELKRQLSSP